MVYVIEQFYFSYIIYGDIINKDLCVYLYMVYFWVVNFISVGFE